MSIAGSHKTVTLNAIVYPACLCGKPWNQHVVEECQGYTPSRPVENLGTVSFTSHDLIANALWSIELFIRKLRVARVRSL